MVRRTVLIVEDNKVNRQLLRKILSDDYSIIEATDGEIALSILRENHEIISAVLLDILMPVLDGYEVLRQMRENADWSKIPVIVASGQDDPGAEERALALGANDYIVKPYKPAILHHKIANTIYLRETASFVNSVQNDALTGVLSKQYFYVKAEEAITRNPHKKYDIVCCDIERFKLVNDLFGTKTGDALLCFVADTLVQFIGGRGICGRLGSDVFAVLIAHPEEYKPVWFGQLIEAVNRFDINLSIVLRFGIYCIDTPDTPLSSMCDRACIAKETVKGKYNTFFAYYDDTARQKLLLEQRITSCMEKALEEGQFRPYFQPKYDLKTEKIVGAEALVRWIHPEMGFMSPAQFIPLFECNGFITNLDLYIWDFCCRAMRVWMDAGHKPVPLSVNVSRADIYNPHLVDILLAMLKKHGIAPKYLHLEITETAYTENPEQLISVVTRLKKLGFRIEMDDFGTGYSSLNMIAELPIDILKLDMRFIQGNKIFDNKNILSFIIGLAKWLNLSVIAEGVETLEQVRLLQSLRCEAAQGYYYAKPLPQADFEALLLRSGFAHAHAEPEDAIAAANLPQPAPEGLKVLAVLDAGGSDYAIFESYFKTSYQVIQLCNAQEALALVHEQKDAIAVLAVNSADIADLDCMETLQNACKIHNIPTILICDKVDTFVSDVLSLGAADYLLRPYNAESFHHRVENAIYRCRILQFEKEREINAAILDIKKRAERDALTGLFNRTEFRARVSAFYQDNKKPDGVFVLLDIDNFKRVNDTLGHLVGDEVLCATARAISELFCETDLVSRIGGDEFALFIPFPLSRDELEAKLQTLCRSIASPTPELSISCSAGIAFSPEFGTDCDTLYAHADIALLFAKRKGKSRFSYFKEGMRIPTEVEIDEKAALLLDNTAEAMFVCDANTNNIVYINDTACQIVGKSKDQCLGCKCYELFWNSCRNCERCLSINQSLPTFYEEDTCLTDNTPVHIKATLGQWNGRCVKMHYLQLS